jgi:hypothetical protein
MADAKERAEKREQRATEQTLPTISPDQSPEQIKQQMITAVNRSRSIYFAPSMNHRHRKRSSKASPSHRSELRPIAS